METLAETPLLWVGLVVVGACLLGIAGSLPTRPPPNAAAAAGTVDRVAASGGPVRATRSLAATAVRVRPRGIALRSGDGAAGEGAVSRARFAFGPVTPVAPDSPLRAVLEGAPPEAVFDDPTSFRQAVVEARATPTGWVKGRTLYVRGVSWDGYRVTLVGV